MQLVVVSGFLGSGKTTLLIQLGKTAAEKGLRAAILVNEIGEVLMTTGVSPCVRASGKSVVAH